MPPKFAKRSTATHRRADAIEAGLRVLADLGPTTAAVQQVAAEIGVSPPYVFRLFGGKQGFFVACLDELEDRVRTVFATAATEEPFGEMGARFREHVRDGVFSGLLVQALAAARHDEVIAARCRSLIAGVLEEVAQTTGATDETLAGFLADGALVFMLQAIGADLTEGSRAAVTALRKSV
ncbi:hypothetical protein Afil01_58680 [Actinorhabdospora filicis]|uniref:HTH tetR-type domain-containing protein n=1 Tax=Actinorhabdospora filicis TaxID=1785913 RepID=A0A9W6SRK2_9ACTN|nr:TetR family transcriptional regulator [Actinorhabdospora filicis]GLZ81061.1 hypothetical protein Afil01_58680 [Actinorhabdospora filicis]